MLNRTPYMLKEGTVLDDRYVVGDVLGMGGFGIVYRCTSTLTGETVCVKEFFCRDYMSRDVRLSDEVRLDSDEDQERFENEKARFLKEARILGDFVKEEAIVHIFGQFEANETSYIAMEYTEGKTLRQAVTEDGPFPDQAIFRKCIPLLETLERIHAAGVIHRDISPDNIMLLPDGTLKLMDFGAAGVFDTSEKTRSLIYKESYSPMEQLGKKNGRQGPWSDLFALCGTLYFCVTGNAPEDAFQRALYDDLKKPSEIAGKRAKKNDPVSDRKKPKHRKAGKESGSGVSVDADRIIMKGLRLAPEDRWASAGELLAEIKQIWPVLSPEELARKKKRRRRILAACIAAAVCVIAALSWYMWNNSTRIRFRQISTQRVFLLQGDYADEEFEEAISGIRGRVEAWVGSRNYLLEKKKGGYLLTVPADSFGSSDVSVTLRGLITRKGNKSLVIWSDDGDPTVIDVPRGSFEEIHLTDDGLELVMADSIAAKVGALASEEGNVLILASDRGDYSQSYVYWTLTTAGDGKTLRLDLNQADTTQTLAVREKELLYYDLTTDPLKINVGFIPETLAEWESADDPLVSGSNQVNHSDLTGKRVRLLYTGSSDVTEERGAYLSSMAVMKDRLDTLGVPYAFGLDYYGHNGFVVELPVEALYTLTVETLGDRASIGIGTLWGKSYLSSKLLNVTDSQGSFSLTMDYTDSYDRSSLEEAIENAEKAADHKLYLYINYNKIAWVDAEEAKAEFTEHSTISFDHWNLEGLDEMRPETRFLADYITVLSKENPQNTLNLEDDPDTYTGIYTAAGEFYPDSNVEYSGPYTDYTSDETIQKFKALFAKQISEKTVSFFSDDLLSGTDITVTRYVNELPNCREWFKEAETIYRTGGLEDGRFNEVTLYIQQTNDRYLSLQFSRNYDAGAMQISYIGGPSEYQEEADEILTEDAFYKELSAVSEAHFYVSP